MTEFGSARLAVLLLTPRRQQREANKHLAGGKMIGNQLRKKGLSQRHSKLSFTPVALDVPSND